MMRRAPFVATALLAALALVACGNEPEEPEPTGGGASTVPSQTGSVTEPPSSVTASPGQDRLAPPEVVGEIATGLNSPWSIAFLPDGTALVSQRNNGAMLHVDGTGGVSEIGRVPGVVHSEESGLHGLAISPDFATDQYVYAYYGTGDDNRIARMTFDGAALGEPEVVLDGLRFNTIHNGGRIHFGPDGMLYAGVGDAGEIGLAQDTASLHGKILRMMPDGSVPADNPFGNLVWSYGHRNVQGFGWDDEGRMWASEFGQDTWDELNLIEPGQNYGWPVVEGVAQTDGMVDPVAQWRTDDASPSGVAVVGSSVYLASLKGERLWQVPAPGSDSSLEPVAYFTGEYGRLRDVVEAPDGTLWLLTNNTDGRGDPRDGDDRILQLDITP